MLRAYKYRLYPTKAQKILLNKHFGACRMVYNLGLEIKISAWQIARKNVSAYDLMRQLTEAKKDFEWLNEIDRRALDQSLLNLDDAFSKFFKGSGFPKFKTKRGEQAYTHFCGKNIRLFGGKMFISKFRDGIRIVETRTMCGVIKRYTVSKTTTGKYFISITTDDSNALPEKKPVGDSVGIDLGLNYFAIISNGIKIENPRHLRNSIRRINVLQRRLRNKKKGSNNKKKAYKRVAVLYERIANQRKDFLHKLSTQLINNHDTLCFENLNVSGMMKNRKLALPIADAGWGEFVRQCKYKGEWYGKNILQLPTFQPSTKICSSCEAINNTLTLSDREWTCANCGTLHDRDINAAINIKNYCIKNSGQVLPGEPVEMSALMGIGEAGSENYIHNTTLK